MLQAQLIGFISALRHATGNARKYGKIFTTNHIVVIFSDYLSALELLKGGQQSLPSRQNPGQLHDLFDEAVGLVDEIRDYGFEVELHWMPRDTGCVSPEVMGLLTDELDKYEAKCGEERSAGPGIQIAPHRDIV